MPPCRPPHQPRQVCPKLAVCNCLAILCWVHSFGSWGQRLQFCYRRFYHLNFPHPSCSNLMFHPSILMPLKSQPCSCLLHATWVIAHWMQACWRRSCCSRRLSSDQSARCASMGVVVTTLLSWLKSNRSRSRFDQLILHLWSLHDRRISFPDHAKCAD